MLESKLFDRHIMVFLKDFLEKVDFENTEAKREHAKLHTTGL